jgi:hypothetical protein
VSRGAEAHPREEGVCDETGGEDAHQGGCYFSVMSLILLKILILVFLCRVTHGCSTEGVCFPCNI